MVSRGRKLDAEFAFRRTLKLKIKAKNSKNIESKHVPGVYMGRHLAKAKIIQYTFQCFISLRERHAPRSPPRVSEETNLHLT